MEDEVDGVDGAWDVAAECEKDVDDKVDAAAATEDDGNGWEEDGEDDHTNVRGTHLDCVG